MGRFAAAKGDLFEGGTREPLIARWTGHVTAGRTDTQTVMWMPDLFPTLTQIAGVANPAECHVRRRELEPGAARRTIANANQAAVLEYESRDGESPCES